MAWTAGSRSAAAFSKRSVMPPSVTMSAPWRTRVLSWLEQVLPVPAEQLSQLREPSGIQALDRRGGRADQLGDGFDAVVLEIPQDHDGPAARRERAQRGDEGQPEVGVNCRTAHVRELRGGHLAGPLQP